MFVDRISEKKDLQLAVQCSAVGEYIDDGPGRLTPMLMVRTQLARTRTRNGYTTYYVCSDWLHVVICSVHVS